MEISGPVLAHDDLDDFLFAFSGPQKPSVPKAAPTPSDALVDVFQEAVLLAKDLGRDLLSSISVGSSISSLRFVSFHIRNFLVLEVANFQASFHRAARFLIEIPHHLWLLRF